MKGWNLPTSWTADKTINLKICCVQCYIPPSTQHHYLQVVTLKPHHNGQQAQYLPTSKTFYRPQRVYVCMYESDDAIRSNVVFISLYEMYSYVMNPLDRSQICTSLDVPRLRPKIEDNKYIGNIYKIASTAVQYRVIHKSLRNFRTRLRNNQDIHGRKEHINR